jgi:DHA2 family multidrug resistance protein
LLFVPLTTVTNDPIPRQEMGNATSLFNLMRNIGASIGIASVTTIVSRHTQAHINNLSQNVSALNPIARQTFEMMKTAFMARGMDATTASNQAYAAMFGMVQRQAAMMSYIDTFFLLAILFITMLPLILIMKRPTKQGGTAEAMAH